MASQQIQKIEQYWDSFSESYVSMDDATNVIYLSLLNMLKIEKRNNILEVGAGAGFLYHHTLKRINPQATYTATDLSEKMLQIMCRRLNIEGNTKEKVISKENKLTIEKANGDQLNYDDNTFDCYIANLCLQVTADPQKMLAESYRVLQKGGVAGFSVWGDKDKSSIFTLIPKVLIENGYKPNEERSNFHLNDRENLIKMMENAGFSNVICWNQFTPFHITNDEEILQYLNSTKYNSVFETFGDKKDEIKEKVIIRVKDFVQQQKLPLGLDSLVIIGVKN